MKILLVVPFYKWNKDQFYNLPLGLAYINAAVRNANFDISVLNLNEIDTEDIYGCLTDKIITDKIDCVLCGGLSPIWEKIKKVFDVAKQINPNIITIGGGGLFTSEPIAAAELLEVDYAVIGEGEITCVELLQTLSQQGGENNVSKVKGIVYKTAEGIYKQTPLRGEIKDLDSIAFPCYDGFEVERYLDSQKIQEGHMLSRCIKPRLMSMILGRSCPYSCKFCFHPTGSTYRTRSLDNFFVELDYLMEKYNLTMLFVADELFSVRHEKVYEFCKRIKPYNIKWCVQMRVDTVTKDLLQAMHDAGCFSISYGLESYSPKILKNMRKHIAPEDINKTLKLTYDASIDIQGNFIFGDELEDLHSVYETMRFWFQHPEYMINLGVIQTYPASGYHQELVKRGINRKEFLENSNWTLNLTQYPYEIWWKYYTVIILLAFYYHPKSTYGILKNVHKNENGEWIFDAKCAHCGVETNVWGVPEIMMEHSWFILTCPECNHRSKYIWRRDKLVNWDKLEYLCRMVADARNEHDFKEAVDTLYRMYMSLRDPIKPFPKIKTI